MHPLDRLRETRLLPVIIGLAIVALGLLLIRLAHILQPFLWATITAYVLYPLVVRIERGLRLPRALVIAAIYVVFIGFLVFVGLRIVPTVFDQARSFISSLPELIDTARSELVREPRITIGGFTIDTVRVNERIDELAQQLAERFGREAVPLVLHTLGLLINILVYLLATYYFLLHGDLILRRLRFVAPPRHHPTVERITTQVNNTFGSYIRAQLILFVIMSVSTFIALTLLQVDYALALAIATGALELIPIIGPWTAGTIATLVALSQGDAPFGWTPLQLAAVVALVYFVLRMVEDHLVIPQLVGRIVRLHPVLVIFGVLAGSSLAGPLGLLIAVPTLAALKIIVLALVEEFRHPPARKVVPLRRPGDLAAFMERIGDYRRQHVVLLVAPGAIGWDDLETAQQLAAEALVGEIRLQVVTPDQVAASIATAAGIEVITRVRVDEEAGVLAEQEETPQPTGPRPTPPASPSKKAREEPAVGGAARERSVGDA